MLFLIIIYYIIHKVVSGLCRSGFGCYDLIADGLRCAHKFEWLVGSVYMNCEGVRKGENILKLEYTK